MLMTWSKRTKWSVYIFIGVLAILSLLEPALFLFLTLPLLFVAVGYVTAKKALKSLPEGWLFILIGVMIGGVAVFISAIVAYTALEMIYFQTTNDDLNRQEILSSAAQTARNVTVFLAFLFSYFNFLSLLDRRREEKKKD